MAGMLYQLNGDAVAAQEIILAVLPKLESMSLNQDDPLRLYGVYMQLSQLATAAGRPDQSIEWLERSISQLPSINSRWACSYVAAIYQTMNDMQNADAWMTRALKLSPPQDAGMQYQLGLLLAYGERDMPGALAAYRQAVEWAPENALYRRAEARTLVRLGYIDEAIAEYQSILASVSGDQEAQNALTSLTRPR